MKTALITTTVNVPHVLKLYRKLGPDVRFFVAGDHKTPALAYDECGEDLNIEFDSPNQQMQKGWKCSDLIGWNCVERRNIALLEAVKWGADVIVTCDDDNVPIPNPMYSYFSAFAFRMLDVNWKIEEEKSYWEISGPKLYSGLEASSPTGWFDPGALLVPQTKHRGFPIGIKSEPEFGPIVDARIGVAQGLCLGDPDIDAVTRIATAPIIHSVSELGRAGIVTDPRKTKTVFNTQNTAFIREMAPAMFQPPGVGRFSDIYASLICQRVMAERGLHVHFGQPFIWQQRNKHNLIDDLKWEISGMAEIEEFAAQLSGIQLEGKSVLEDTRRIYASFDEETTPGLRRHQSTAALAFLDDIEQVL